MASGFSTVGPPFFFFFLLSIACIHMHEVVLYLMQQAETEDRHLQHATSLPTTDWYNNFTFRLYEYVVPVSIHLLSLSVCVSVRSFVCACLTDFMSLISLCLFVSLFLWQPCPLNLHKKLKKKTLS